MDGNAYSIHGCVIWWTVSPSPVAEFMKSASYPWDIFEYFSRFSQRCNVNEILNFGVVRAT